MKTWLTVFGLVGLTLSCSTLIAQEVVSELAEEPAAQTEAVEAPVAAPATSVLDEKVIPEAYTDARYQTTWSSNPFLKKTVAIAGPKVVWSQDWALAGMYKSTTGKITISLQNKQTSEFKRVTNDEKADSEFKLIKANFNRNRSEASAEISKGSETATLKYDDSLTARPVTINNTLRPATGGAPGNPNQQPQQQPRAGQPVNVTQPGGARPGMPNMPQPGGSSAIQPGPTGAAPTPPTISRRRQLIPAPVAPQPAQ